MTEAGRSSGAARFSCSLRLSGQHDGSHGLERAAGGCDSGPFALSRPHRGLSRAGASIYTLFSIYPLSTRSASASMPAMRPGGALRRLRRISTRFSPIRAGRASSGMRFRNNLVFFAIHMVVQNASVWGSPCCSACRAHRQQRLPHAHLPADHAVGRHHRLHLAAHPVNPLWGIAPGALDAWVSAACSRPWLGQEIDRAGDGLAHLGLAVRRHSDDADLRSAPQHSRRPRSMPRPSTAAGPFSVFWFVRLPLILPTLGVVSILTFVANFNAFDLIYAIKGALGGTEFFHRHSRHVLLPHLLRLPAPARQPDHGGGGGDRHADHHPDRRA